MKVLGVARCAAALLLTAAHALHAQRGMPTKVGDISIGVHIGPSINWMTGSDVTSSASTVGFVLGVDFDYHLKGHRYIGTGLQVARRGGAEAGAGFRDEVNVTHIEVPARIGATFPNTRHRPFIHTGFIYGFQVGCTFTAKSGAFSSSGDCTNPSSTNLGFLFGGGIQVALPANPRIHVEFERFFGNIESAVKALPISGRFGVGLRF